MSQNLDPWFMNSRIEIDAHAQCREKLVHQPDKCVTAWGWDRVKIVRYTIKAHVTPGCVATNYHVI